MDRHPYDLSFRCSENKDPRTNDSFTIKSDKHAVSAIVGCNIIEIRVQ
jgi:hypothetical protein